MGNTGSRCHRMNNVPQGSVNWIVIIESPTLFNLYVSDLPKTKGAKFKFTEYIAIACQSKELDPGQRVFK